jgi:hypothetical protein
MKLSSAALAFALAIAAIATAWLPARATAASGGRTIAGPPSPSSVRGVAPSGARLANRRASPPRSAPPIRHAP